MALDYGRCRKKVLLKCVLFAEISEEGESNSGLTVFPEEDWRYVLLHVCFPRWLDRLQEMHNNCLSKYDSIQPHIGEKDMVQKVIYVKQVKFKNGN